MKIPLSLEYNSSVNPSRTQDGQKKTTTLEQGSEERNLCRPRKRVTGWLNFIRVTSPGSKNHRVLTRVQYRTLVSGFDRGKKEDPTDLTWLHVDGLSTKKEAEEKTEEVGVETITLELPVEMIDPSPITVPDTG